MIGKEGLQKVPYRCSVQMNMILLDLSNLDNVNSQK
jgi:hypothetical protein